MQLWRCENYFHTGYKYKKSLLLLKQAFFIFCQGNFVDFKS